MKKNSRWKKGNAWLLVSAMLVASVFTTITAGAVDEVVPTADDDTAAIVSEESIEKDVINVGIETDPSDFGPWTGQSAGRSASMYGVYECLGYVIDGEFYGVLVKDYDLADDGLSLTFNIYDYIYDSEGNHITADDFIFSWETGTGMGNIANVGYVETFEKVDDYTIEMTFNRTLSVGDLDTFWQWYVVSEDAYNASSDGMSTDPVATGPYVFKDYTANYMFTYEKRDDYWQTPELTHARDASNVQTINWYIIPETTQRTMALQSGTIDICSAVSNDDIGKFMDGGEYDDQYNVYAGISNLSSQLYCNCDESSICSDVNLRKAIFYSIDTQTILDSIYAGNGVVMHDIAPSWSVGYIDEWDDEDNYYNYDPEKAAEYLAESSYNGENLKIIATAENNDLAVLVQAFLLQTGINSDVEVLDSAIMYSYTSDPTNYDILITDYATNIYAPDGWAMTLRAANFEWGGTMSFAFDDELQDLLTEATSLDTYSPETVQACHDYIIDNAYGMGLVNGVFYSVVPSDMSEICISFKNYPIPGGCVYVEE